MTTLTVEEAVTGLSHWLELAVAGEQIQIRQGNAVVELRPTRTVESAVQPGQMNPREALQHLQEEARLSSADAKRYLREVREERLAAEDRLGA
jgi:hypothetical protein